ncbi:hypothetical protein ACLB2K_031185 [Fragaria x ananassa]
MRGALRTMEHMEHLDAKKKMDEIKQTLKEKEVECEDLDTLCQTLVVNACGSFTRHVSSGEWMCYLAVLIGNPSPHSPTPTLFRFSSPLAGRLAFLGVVSDIRKEGGEREGKVFALREFCDGVGDRSLFQSTFRRLGLPERSDYGIGGLVAKELCCVKLRRFDMSHRSKEEKDKLSDFKYYEDKYYYELKKGSYKIKDSDSTYRCPFCHEKSRPRYQLKELSRHASSIGRGSHSCGIKDKAKHWALKCYIDKYVDVKSWLELPKELARKIGGPKESAVNLEGPREPAAKRERPTEPAAKTEVSVEPALKKERYLEPAQQIERPTESPKLNDEKLFVWPVMGVLANIKTEFKGGKHVGESGCKIKAELTAKGFNPVRVHPLWNFRGHSGFAVVEFENNWEGFNNGMSFERSFEVERRGKRDYNLTRNRGDQLYGWVARDDDYNSRSIVSDYLRKNGDLKTVSGQQAEEQRKTIKLVSNLQNTLEIKSSHLEEMQKKYQNTANSLNKVVHERDAILKAFNEAMLKLL